MPSLRSLLSKLLAVGWQAWEWMTFWFLRILVLARATPCLLMVMLFALLHPRDLGLEGSLPQQLVYGCVP